MAREDDIKQIIAQEQGLIFPSFDEHIAFSLGARVRERGIKDKLGLVCDIRTWDRPLFYMALPPTTLIAPGLSRFSSAAVAEGSEPDVVRRTGPSRRAAAAPAESASGNVAPVAT